MEIHTKKIPDTERKNPSEMSDPVKKFRAPLVEYLISGLEENNKWVRVMAAELLGMVGDPRAIKSLEPLIVDKDPDIRTISLGAVSRIRSLRSYDTLSRSGECGTCMIRLIAEEAISNRKIRSEAQNI